MWIRTRYAALILTAAALFLGACGAGVRGPWLSANGERLETNQVFEYDGLRRCGQREVVFMEFFGRKFAKDPEGILGSLTGSSGQELTFEIEQGVDGALERTGYIHDVKDPITLEQVTREILVAEDVPEDYLYIAINDEYTERWPRAEITCEG
ncbi:MAG: hypothetical protein OEO77_08430 [Acidimicrobiia bacterium]|nr:hypothetical protein [Acidimicrobiia bacterium]